MGSCGEDYFTGVGILLNLGGGRGAYEPRLYSETAWWHCRSFCSPFSNLPIAALFVFPR